MLQPGPVWIVPAMPHSADTPGGKVVNFKIWINVDPLPNPLPAEGYLIRFSTDRPDLLPDLPQEVRITQVDTLLLVTSAVLTASTAVSLTATDGHTSKTRSITLDPNA